MARKRQHEELVSFESGADTRYLATIEALRRAPSDTQRLLVASSGHAVWPHLVGRGKYGEFPLIVVREHYRRHGYTVWFCEVKWKDHITEKQRVTFPLIERYCGRKGQDRQNL